MTNINTIANMTATIAARYVNDATDKADVTLACQAYVKTLTKAEVAMAYTQAHDAGLVITTPKKRRYLTLVLVALVADTADSRWNKVPRKTLRAMATAMGLTVSNGREKSRFVAVMHVAALATSAGLLIS